MPERTVDMGKKRGRRYLNQHGLIWLQNSTKSFQNEKYKADKADGNVLVVPPSSGLLLLNTEIV